MTISIALNLTVHCPSSLFNIVCCKCRQVRSTYTRIKTKSLQIDGFKFGCRFFFSLSFRSLICAIYTQLNTAKRSFGIASDFIDRILWCNLDFLGFWFHFYVYLNICQWMAIPFNWIVEHFKILLTLISNLLLQEKQKFSNQICRLK